MSSALLRLQPDDRLVALLREGHARAFDEISRRYRACLVRFACGFVPDSSAEDVVQEAMLRAHAALLDGDAEVALRPWLYRIVHNGAISERRTIRLHEELDDQYDGVPQPPDIVERRERFRGILAGIVDLPEAQRDALVSTELEGESHDEIARRLDTTPGGVRQLVFRARTTLRNGIGLLLPMPVLRFALGLAVGPGSGISAGGAAGGAGAAAGGPIKIGATVAATIAVLGSGAALELPSDSKGGLDSGSERSASVAGASDGHRTALAMTPVSALSAKSGVGSGSEAGPSDGAASAGSPQADSGGSAGSGGGGGDVAGDADQPAESAPPVAQQPPPKPPPPPSQPPPSSAPPPPGGGAHLSSTGGDCPPPPDGSQLETTSVPESGTYQPPVQDQPH